MLRLHDLPLYATACHTIQERARKPHAYGVDGRGSINLFTIHTRRHGCSLASISVPHAETYWSTSWRLSVCSAHMYELEAQYSHVRLFTFMYSLVGSLHVSYGMETLLPVR